VRGRVSLNLVWCMPGRGVRAKERGGEATTRAAHRGGAEASVRRGARGSTRGQKKKEALTCTRTLHPRRRRPFQFREPAFEITKLQKVSTNLKISKNKSCRGPIDLQLSQRASYVLINGFVGKSRRSCSFSTARVTVHNGFKSVFG
jgi:hypothetical protein